MTNQSITASQTVGPYLRIGLFREGQEYVVPKDAEGALKICGYVYDGDSQPFPDAMVEIWQANIYGKYNHPEDDTDAELLKNFLGFGRSCTDDYCYFFFVTVKPGRVPGRGNRLQAPHIAASVFARGMLKQQVTRLYFSDEPQANAEDPVLSMIEEVAERNTLLAHYKEEENRLPTYSFDIHLQGKKETVFLDV